MTDRDCRDVLVAGGGPVGLAAAISARLAGLTVTLVEPRSTPVDKACGEGLMPAAVTELARLGVVPEGRPFSGIRYLGGGRCVEARFRHGKGLGVRRTSLHSALAARADELGVTRVTGSVLGIEQDATAVTAGGLRARWLVAADGLHSPLRRSLGLQVEPGAGATARFGLRRHFSVAPWSDLVEVHWERDAEAYVTPVGPDLVGVAFLSGRRSGTYPEMLAGFPALSARLRDAAPASAVRGAGPLRQRATSPRAGRVLLVGDAAGYVDALTGEGLAVGLASARAALEAIVTGRPQDYPAAWRALSRQYRWSAGTLLTVAGHPALRRRLVPAAAGLPRVFTFAVNHVS